MAQQVRVMLPGGGACVYETETWNVEYANSHMNGGGTPILRVTKPLAGGESRVSQTIAEFAAWIGVELIDATS
jgi:hypothetical protein